MLCKIDTFLFIKGFIKVNCKHWRGTWFYLKIVKILQLVPFSKVRTRPRKKFLTKAKALVEIFEVEFLGVRFYKVRSFDVYKTLVEVLRFLMRKLLWMNACMHDLCYTNGENMVRFSP